MCDVQRLPLELLWRVLLKLQDCVLSDWGVSGFMKEVFCTFGARDS